jgi:hypothetical protein
MCCSALPSHQPHHASKLEDGNNSYIARSGLPACKYHIPAPHQRCRVQTCEHSYIPRTLIRHTPIANIALPRYHVSKRTSHWRLSYSTPPTNWLFGDRPTTASNYNWDLADMFSPYQMTRNKNSLLYVPTWHVFCSGGNAQMNMHQHIDILDPISHVAQTGHPRMPNSNPLRQTATSRSSNTLSLFEPSPSLTVRILGLHFANDSWPVMKTCDLNGAPSSIAD